MKLFNVNFSSSFLKWWIFFSSILLGYASLWYFGLFNILYNSDQTKLSFVILSIFTLASLSTGRKIFNRIKKVDVEWYFCESLLKELGMIGTLIGFILMLGIHLAGIDVSNQQTITQAISGISVGMGTALYTTLIGLICSVLLKIQLVLHYTEIEHESS